MNAKKRKIELAKVKEPAVVYESSKLKFEGVNSPNFNFDEEFNKGYTLYKKEYFGFIELAED